MNKKPKIVWIVDVPGWAYENRAKRLAVLLPEYTHMVCYNIVQHLGLALSELTSAAVVVCPDPRLIPLLPHPISGRVVQNVNAIKIFM